MLEGLENEMREGLKGLCADPKPVPPWKWSRDCVCPVERAVHALRKILDFEQAAEMLC